MPPFGARFATRVAGQNAILLLEEWACNVFIEQNPGVTLATLPKPAPLGASASQARQRT